MKNLINPILIKKNQVTSIENSLLNYNRFNSNNRFDNFIVGESNELSIYSS